MKLSSCGLVCDVCESYQSQCNGCQEVQGKPFWTKDVCQLFKCRKNKGFKTCGECGELPCQQFLDLKDPSLSDEEHLVQVYRRMERLLKQ